MSSSATSVAIPAFSDIAKPINDILVGSARAGGIFAINEHRVSINTVTADGLILSAQASSPSGVPSAANATLSAIHAPAKGVALTATLAGSGGATLGATLSPSSVPGLTATISADPFAASAAQDAAAALAANARLTLDYSPPNLLAHFRAASAGVGTGVDVSAVFAAAGPSLLVGGSATLGGAPRPAGPGAVEAGGGGGGLLSGWSVGAAWSRSVGGHHDKPAARQQLTATLTDSGTIKGRNISLMAAQQIGALGRTTIAADAVIPLIADKSYADAVKTGPTPATVSIGVSHRLETGGLAKAKVSHDGAVTLLYEARVQEHARLGTTIHLDPASGYAPKLGLALDLSP